MNEATYCVGRCRLAGDICTGCNRPMSLIRNWHLLTDIERRERLEQLTEDINLAIKELSTRHDL